MPVMLISTSLRYFRAAARAVPEYRAVSRRDRDVTSAEMGRRCYGAAHYLLSRGLGCRTECEDLLPHESCQDQIGPYPRNGSEFLGASESGLQATSISTHESSADAATSTPSAETGFISADFSRMPSHGEGDGWLAPRSLILMGYLRDADTTARTFPVINGGRWSVAEDRARLRADGRIELLGRDSITINSGGEKILVEEVERAVLATHPDVDDVVVVGRPSPRWGSEVAAIIEAVEGTDPSDTDLIDACGRHVVRYKLPRAILRATATMRSPSGQNRLPPGGADRC